VGTVVGAGVIATVTTGAAEYDTGTGTDVGVMATAATGKAVGVGVIATAATGAAEYDTGTGTEVGVGVIATAATGAAEYNAEDGAGDTDGDGVTATVDEGPPLRAVVGDGAGVTVGAVVEELVEVVVVETVKVPGVKLGAISSNSPFWSFGTSLKKLTKVIPCSCAVDINALLAMITTWTDDDENRISTGNKILVLVVLL